MTAQLPSARLAAASDIPVLLDLMEAFCTESGYCLNRQWATDSFLALLRNKPQGETWLVCSGSEVVGYLVLTLRSNKEHEALQAVVNDLFISPAYRRRGLAGFVLQRVLRECRARGVHVIQVEVSRDNSPAKALYSMLGLQPHDDERVMLAARLRTDSSSRGALASNE